MTLASIIVAAALLLALALALLVRAVQEVRVALDLLRESNERLAASHRDVMEAAADTREAMDSAHVTSVCDAVAEVAEAMVQIRETNEAIEAARIEAAHTAAARAQQWAYLQSYDGYDQVLWAARQA